MGYCIPSSLQIPNSMTINGEAIAPPVGKYNLISQTNTIILHYDELKSSYQCLFFGYSDIDEIDTSNLNTSYVNSMKFMFAYCSSLTSINLLNLDTSHVLNMRNMFEGCTSLNPLDLSCFDTSSVQYFRNMFQECSSLVFLNLSNFYTKNGIEMHGMFYGCSALKYLDIHSFDITSAPSMGYMFYNCKSLESLYLSNFDTSNIRDMVNMFRNCQALTSLDLSHFDTSLVSDMRYMFYNCKNLVSLNLSNFNTTTTEKFDNMFYGCKSLKSLDLSHFNTENAVNMEKMFYECNKLESLDVTSFRTLKVKSMADMFARCNSLISLDISGFDTSSLENMGEMFLNDYKLISVDLSNFAFSRVTDMHNAFSGCSNLKYINLKYLIINDAVNYAKLIDNSLINPIICIDDESSLTKIISLFNCRYSDTLENWGEYKDIISNDNNKYINGCLLSKYNSNSNSYQICSLYYYYDESENKYLCTKSLKCPEPYDKLIYGKNECINSCNKTQNNKYELTLGKVCLSLCSNNLYISDDKPSTCIPKCPQERPFLLVQSLECVSNCTITQRQNNLCVTYYIFSQEVNYQIFDEVISQTRYELMNDFDLSVVNGGLINENGDIITITRTKKENTNDNDFYLGECEDRLIEHYNISPNETLYLLRIDVEQIGMQIPLLEYEILYPINGSINLVKLDLSICSG